MASGIRLTYEQVEAAFEAAGCELLDTKYTNARTKLRYRCSCGREAQIVYDSFRRGNRCRSCGGKKAKEKLSFTQDEVAAYFKSQGCELLGEYKGNLVPVEYRCSCGELSMISWNNFKTKGQR